jgi:hypothetical protein
MTFRLVSDLPVSLPWGTGRLELGTPRAFGDLAGWLSHANTDVYPHAVFGPRSQKPQLHQRFGKSVFRVCKCDFALGAPLRLKPHSSFHLKFEIHPPHRDVLTQ